MAFDDAVRYAVAYFEEQSNSILKNAKVHVNYRGNRESKDLIYLLQIEQMDDSTLTNVQINAKTGQLVSIEKAD